MDFPASYLESRRAFLKLLEDVEAELWSFRCPESGPDDEELFFDVGRIGPPEAKKLLVLSTGLHGVEGPVGLPMLQLACQDYARQLPPGVGLLIMHAMDPFGFAWSRRQDHEGIVWYLHNAKPKLKVLTLHGHLQADVTTPGEEVIGKGDYLLITNERMTRTH